MYLITLQLLMFYVYVNTHTHIHAAQGVKNQLSNVFKTSYLFFHFVFISLL